MDALKALASQQGCSADGTATGRNPVSKFFNQVGADGRPIGARTGHAHPNQELGKSFCSDLSE